MWQGSRCKMACSLPIQAYPIIITLRFILINGQDMGSFQLEPAGAINGSNKGNNAKAEQKV